MDQINGLNVASVMYRSMPGSLCVVWRCVVWRGGLKSRIMLTIKVNSVLLSVKDVQFSLNF